MPKLGTLSQNIQDQFFQDYAPENSFMGDVQVDFLVYTQYSEIIQQYYQQNYIQNLGETGYGTVDLSQDWLVAVEAELKKDGEEFYIDLPNRPFSFMYDKQTSAISGLFATAGNKCGRFTRTTVRELGKLDHIPITSRVFWYYVPCKIHFKNMKCKPEKITVYYLPAMGDEIDSNFIIPDGIATQVMESVLNIMFAAKNGNLVDMTTDGNPNKIPQTETNTTTIK